MSNKKAEIILNEEHDGIEIYFDERPEDEVLDVLHAEGWRWHKKKRCWYNYNSEEHMVTATRLCIKHNGYDYSWLQAKENKKDLIYEDYDFDPSEWDEESILKKHGYSVSQEEGLTVGERQRILSMVIRNHVMTAYQVINHIERMVNLRDKQSKYDLACKKWREDMQFVMREFC